ncbi:hypothetical protein NEMIN01_0687 [Nematocida minor]|uniref:uncharacterized protein n=1 Tax=Nematocida minor TaxID=1912983 RepID=UPI00221F0E0D|nr:uncharacterized protein NEMIN01_0687 [Nematocida minor]KAI5189824.1 hypothetical protein NEMIN01_0687 [Nematocida minor]
MKEVKLVINIKGIVEVCQAMKSMNDIKAAIKHKDNISQLTILKRLLKDNLRIENSPYTNDDDNQYIIETAENEICQYFVYRYPVFPRAISELNDAIKNEEDESIRSHAIELANKIMEMNPLIYRIEHGISRKSEAVEEIKSDVSNDKLGTRTCTLEINDVKFPSLKRMAKYSTESLNRYVSQSISRSLDSENLLFLNESTPIGEYHTLNELYTNTCEGTDVLLIEYGMDLIHKKYVEIRDIVQKVMEMKNSMDKKQYIIDQVNALFASKEDSKAVLSIIKNIGPILIEKEIQKYMINAVVYMVNNTDLLGEKGAPKTLKLEKDLSNFAKDYIDIGAVLEKKVETEIDKLKREKRELEKGKRKEELEAAEKIKLLDWKLKRENSQYDEIILLQDSLQHLENLDPAQVNYLYKKIGEFLKAENVKAIELEKPEEAIKAPETKLNEKEQPPLEEQTPPRPLLDEQPKTDMHAQASPLNNQPPLEEQAAPHPASTKSKIVSTLKIVVSVFLVVLFIVSTIVFGYRIENRMKSTNN